MQCSTFSGRLGRRPYRDDLHNALLSSLQLLAMGISASRKGAKEVLCSLLTGPLACNLQLSVTELVAQSNEGL